MELDCYLKPFRQVTSIEELYPEEVVDIFLSLQTVIRLLKEVFNHSSTTIFASDGNSKVNDNL